MSAPGKVAALVEAADEVEALFQNLKLPLDAAAALHALWTVRVALTPEEVRRADGAAGMVATLQDFIAWNKEGPRRLSHDGITAKAHAALRAAGVES